MFQSDVHRLSSNTAVASLLTTLKHQKPSRERKITQENVVKQACVGVSATHNTYDLKIE